MSITVELFGVPRQRAGAASLTVEAKRLGDVLEQLANRFPDLAETCFDQQNLKPGYLANLDGERFIRDPDTPLRDGASLLILSADAGG